MIIAEVMKRGVYTCSPTDTLQVPAQIMWEHDCGSVPIVDQDGRVVGMITDRDICMAAYLRGQRLQDCVTCDVMARPAVACRPGDPVEKAELAMREHQVRRLPIIGDDQRLTGIVSVNDLLLAAPEDERAPKDRRPGDAERHALLSTLAAICQHRQRAAAEAA